MTVSSVKVRVLRKPIVKARFLAQFPSGITPTNFLTLDKSGGSYTFGVDYTKVAPGILSSAANAYTVVYDLADGIYKLVSVADQIASGQTQQIKTTPGDVAVLPTDSLIAINKTTGQATNVILPLASSKSGPVKVADFKGDAGTNNITIITQGSDKFSGGLTSWIIGADTGSVLLHPIPGSGYAV